MPFRRLVAEGHIYMLGLALFEIIKHILHKSGLALLMPTCLRIAFLIK